jgi:hypothetical protein
VGTYAFLQISENTMYNRIKSSYLVPTLISGKKCSTSMIFTENRKKEKLKGRIEMNRQQLFTGRRIALISRYNKITLSYA